MLDTLDGRGNHLSVALAVQGEDDRLLQNDLLGLVQGSPATLGVGAQITGGALVNDGIVVGIAPQTVVVGVAGHPHTQIGHGVGVVGAPAGQAQLKGAVLHILHTLLLGLHGQVDGQALQRGLQLLLDDLSHLLGCIVGIHHHIKGEGILAQLSLGGLKELLGLLGVISAVICKLGLVGAEIAAVGAGCKLCGNSGVCGGGAILQHIAGNGITIQRKGHGLAQVQVCQIGHSVDVGADVPQVTGTHAGKLGIILDLIDLLTVQQGDIQCAGLIAHQSLLAVLDDLIGQTVQSDLIRIIVIGVLFHRKGGGGGLIIGQHERAVGQHRFGAGAKGVSAGVVEGLVHRVEGGEVHQAQEVADRNVQLHLQGLVIHSGHAQVGNGLFTGNDLSGVDHLTNVGQHVGILGSGGGVYGTLPAKHKVSGGHGLTVGPLCIAQVEGVGLAVLADVISLRHGGNCCTVSIHLHQAIGVIRDDLKGGAVGGHLGVQRLDLGLQHDVQGAALCGASRSRGSAAGCRRCSHGAGRAAAGCQSQRGRGDTGSCQEAAARNTTIEFHICFPLSLMLYTDKASISENAQGALLPLWSFCTPLCHGRIIPLFPAVEKGFSGICPPKRPISPLCPTSRRKWKLIFV